MAVLGAGIMGGGIAQVAARAGIEVRIKDIDADPLGAALDVARRRFDYLQRRRRISAAEVAEGMARISATTRYDGFRRSDRGRRFAAGRGSGRRWRQPASVR